MLTKMTLTNFLSFREKTIFDFTPSKYGILNETNVSSNGVLKGGFFVGPNASGKTNALKGINFLLKLMKGENIILKWNKCLFGTEKRFQAAYEFLIQGALVSYTVGFDVEQECLDELLVVDGKKVLARRGTHGELNLGENLISDDQLDGQTAYLRTASFNTGRFPQHPVLHELMEFILNSTCIDGDNFEAAIVKHVEMYAEKNGVDALNCYLKEFHYDFFVEFGSQSQGEDVALNYGDQKHVFMKRNDFQLPMPLALEAQGNRVFISMLPHLIDAIERPGMLLIDEFGNSLHNNLAEKIVRFFMKKADQSQLFISSHGTNLISNAVFRPDQIQMVTFHGKRGSTVERISKYKPREAQNLEKMYLGGMFEGLPDYGEDI
ncbi:MAG: AAA family ATPase [Oscillibacter sp.]|jgi:predicted ATP-binding protein involved in virulence|nr:AAA family ATPase [Oscillibacter sp.]